MSGGLLPLRGMPALKQCSARGTSSIRKSPSRFQPSNSRNAGQADSKSMAKVSEALLSGCSRNSGFFSASFRCRKFSSSGMLRGCSRQKRHSGRIVVWISVQSHAATLGKGRFFQCNGKRQQAGSTSPPYGRRGHETRWHRSPASASCRRAGQTIPIFWHSVHWNRRKRQRSVVAGRLVVLHIPLRQCPTDGLLPVVRVRYSSSSAVLPLAYGYIPRQGRCVAVLSICSYWAQVPSVEEGWPGGSIHVRLWFRFSVFLISASTSRVLRASFSVSLFSALIKVIFHSVCQLV